MKMLKMFGFGTALTASGLAFGWRCDLCGKEHHGRKCPAITLGLACDDHRNYGEPYGCFYQELACDDHRNYGCEPYGCFYQDNYACYDDGFDSDEENHEQTIQSICNSFSYIQTVYDLRLVQGALNERANELGLHLNQYGCIDDGYGCQNFYGCHDFDNYGCDNMPIFECNENRYDCNDYGCHDHYNDYGCFDPYGCR